jgi:hypothetical protein
MERKRKRLPKNDGIKIGTGRRQLRLTPERVSDEPDYYCTYLT